MSNTKYYCNRHYCAYDAMTGCEDCNAEQAAKRQKEQEDNWLEWHCLVPGYEPLSLSSEAQEILDNILSSYIYDDGET